jgi:hypothetical protein
VNHHGLYILVGEVQLQLIGLQVLDHPRHGSHSRRHHTITTQNPDKNLPPSKWIDSNMQHQPHSSPHQTLLLRRNTKARAANPGSNRDCVFQRLFSLRVTMMWHKNVLHGRLFGTENVTWNDDTDNFSVRRSAGMSLGSACVVVLRTP